MKKQDEIRDRLIDLAISAIHLGESMPKTAEGRMAIAQILRSGTAAAIAYCRAEVVLVQEANVDGVQPILELLDEAESLVSELVGFMMIGNHPGGFIRQKRNQLRDFLERRVKAAMRELWDRVGTN